MMDYNVEKRIRIEFLFFPLSFSYTQQGMKKLVIAEKPSVGREIAKTLNLRERGNGYIEGSEYVVTWALGHLVELAEPSHYSERYKRWSLNDLPMLPEKLDERVIDETKDQFNVIASLLKRNDVSSVVIATDAALAGEESAFIEMLAQGYDKLRA